MSCTDTPENEGCRYEYHGDAEKSEAMLGLHNTIVAARKLQSQPIADFTKCQVAEKDSEAAGQIAETDLRGAKVVWWFGQNQRDRSVEHV